MWACFHKTCLCLPRRGDTHPPFNHYSYDDEDNVEFENLLAQQEPDTIAAFLSRSPFQRTLNTQGYTRASQLSLGDDIIGDEATIQTQDAQFLPDEQISKLTELTIEQSKTNQVIDAQLAAEEEEARLLEEAEIERKQQAARQAAISKGLLPDEEDHKDTFFTITGDDEVDAEEVGSLTKPSTANQNDSARQLEEQVSILNRPRNPHQRLFTTDINPEDYEDDGPPPNSKDQPQILAGTPLGPPLSATIQEVA